MQVHYMHCKKNFSSLKKTSVRTVCTRYEVTTISFSTDLDEAQVELKKGLMHNLLHFYRKKNYVN